MLSARISPGDRTGGRALVADLRPPGAAECPGGACRIPLPPAAPPVHGV